MSTTDYDATVAPLIRRLTSLLKKEDDAVVCTTALALVLGAFIATSPQRIRRQLAERICEDLMAQADDA